MKRFFVTAFALILFIPGAAWILDGSRANGDNTSLKGFPIPDRTSIVQREYYLALEAWFDDSLPLSKTFKIAHNWLNYKLFSSSATPAVRVGIHGWLFPAPSPATTVDSPDLSAIGRRLLLTLHAAKHIVSAAGKEFLVTVVPTKATIYPEFTQHRNDALKGPLYQALLAANRQHPLEGLVQLEPALIKAKLNGSKVFHERSHLWSCDGARSAAEQILRAGRRPLPTGDAHVGATCPGPDDRLYRRLLGQQEAPDDPPGGHTAGPYLIGGPAAVVYGDEWLNRLLPFISRGFGSVDVIDANQTPTAGGNLLERSGDLIMIECAAAHLSRLHIDLEGLYRAAGAPLAGVVRRSVDLSASRAMADCALASTPDGLEIRASSTTAEFNLPPLDGSTTSIFRMAKLIFSDDHHGVVTTRFPAQVGAPFETPLSRENHVVLVPLPIADRVTLSVNPSPNPGVFILEQVELISFYGDNPPPPESQVQRDGDIYSGLAINPVKAPPALPAPRAGTPPHPTQALPALTLTDIEDGRVFQRRGHNADIVVSGTYHGTTGPVEARVVADTDNTVQVPWTVVDDAPENGVFTGILRHVPQGGWYRIEVRSGLTPWVVERGTNRWSVGMLVACIGQSNMREWFTTGEDDAPSSRLMIHRGGKWHVPASRGNGALALGNRLVEGLGIPVGLLDYSVNGSGLTAEADWGTGFWRDTAPDGIYRQFVDGVQRTGGSLEAVVWMQGEADAARGTITRQTYGQALARFVDDQLRIDIGNGSTRPQLPFLIIPLVRRPTGKDEPCQWIRQAQMDAIDGLDDCYLGATSMDLKNHGRQHLAPEAYTTLGRRTAQTILHLAGKTRYYRGPSVSGVTRASPTVVDVTVRHRGGNDFTPMAGITGFSVVAGDRDVEVVSAMRLNSTTIRLKLAAPLPAEYRVRYLYGAHPDVSGAVHDNTKLRLPLDPFDGS